MLTIYINNESYKSLTSFITKFKARLNISLDGLRENSKKSYRLVQS